jgi:hypothetical protein
MSGTIMAAGGTVNLVGTLDNTNATLVAPSSGSYTLYGATITGGTVGSGALAFSSNGGTLSGVTLSGNFSSASSANFDVDTNTTFTGGTTSFGGSSYIYLGGTGNALTLTPSATWNGDVALYGMGTSSQSISLQGIINETGFEYFYGNSYGLSILNSGSLNEAAGGTLILGYYVNDSFTNASSGSVMANGGTIYLDYNLSTDTNLSGNTLTGGTWGATNGGLLQFMGTGNQIVTNQATLILDGASSQIRTNFGGSSQTLESTLATNNGTLEVLSGRNFAATNPITNNGTILLGGGTFSAPTLVNVGASTLAGNGTYAPASGGVTFGSGATVSPGATSATQYVNSLNFTGPLTFGPAGTYVFDFYNGASPIAGVDNDTINVSGNFTLTATPSNPFTIDVESINVGSGLPGGANINLSQSTQWTILTATSISGFNASSFVIDTSGFANLPNYTGFSIAESGNSLVLDFTPVPEPSTWALMGMGLAALTSGALRRKIRALAR